MARVNERPKIDVSENDRNENYDLHSIVVPDSYSTLATYDVRTSTWLAIIVKSTDAGSTISIEGSTVEDPDDATDDHWAPLHEYGKTVDITGITVAQDNKDLFELLIKTLSYVRVRAKNTIAMMDATLIINSRISTRV